MNLKPVVPFEPIADDHIPKGPNWISQIKWDGVRMLTYCDGQDVRLVNRSLNERTGQYPELLDISSYCGAKSVILDGEIIAFDDSRPSFREVMRRDGIRKLQAVPPAAREIPVTYMIFDLLYLNGEWVTDKPLRERQELLYGIVRPTGRVRLVDNAADGERLFDVMKQHGMEGVVSKDLTSTYALGGKDGRWKKRKYIRDLVAVVGGVTLNAGRVNALLLGMHDEAGDLIYIGHAGTGKLTMRDWQAVTEAALRIRTDERPFKNMPERHKDAVWIRPIFKAKVNYLEWTVHGTLRQPVIQAIMGDN